MAADVSYFLSLRQESNSNSEILITKDLLGGLSKISNSESDLGSKVGLFVRLYSPFRWVESVNMMRNSEGFFLFGIFSSMEKNGRDASHQIRRYRQFLHQKIRITRRICLRKQTQMRISRIWTIRRRRSTTFWKKPAWIWSCNPRQAITKVFVLWTRSNPHCKEPKNGPWRKNKPLILQGRPLSLHLRLHLQAPECSQQAALAACFM